MNKVIGGIPVQITKKNIKNMYLYIKPPEGRVEINAPRFAREEDVEAFIMRKRSWILRKQEEVRRKSEGQIRRYVSGETVQVWGRPLELEVRESGRRRIRLVGGQLFMECRSSDDTEIREKLFREYLRMELKARISERLPEIENVTGLHCTSWQTKIMRTRWGTCNTGTHKIWLNVMLAEKDPICLDYVIVHELVHTKVADHGPRFKAYMDRLMPQWREIRRFLNHGK